MLTQRSHSSEEELGIQNSNAHVQVLPKSLRKNDFEKSIGLNSGLPSFGESILK